MNRKLKSSLVTKITILLAFLVSGGNLVYCIVKNKELTNPVVLFGFMLIWTLWYFIKNRKKETEE